ncbi:MAG: recombinase family protein [Phascolarctobacterium sp.]|nr:recombinase family protein [Phascolarctobacterium sp.]MDO4922057.1 recombinase family protein [Phascolarctobacterium sp.]
MFKLSRFGRNAADVLSSLQVMQDFGVNLVCVEDGINSSKDAGKLMISVLSAVQGCMGTKVSSTRKMAPSIKTFIITDANIAP